MTTVCAAFRLRACPARLGYVLTWLLAGLLPLLARAQAPGWAAAVPGSLTQVNGNSSTRAIATDASGNVFVTGVFTGQVAFGDTRLSTAGVSDLFVAKWVPATGTWAWAASAGGTGTDQGSGIAVSGNSVYVTGAITNSNAGTNANGVFFGNSGGSPGSSPQLGASTNAGNTDLVLAKYTDNGPSATFQWSQVGGGFSSDQGLGVAVSTPADGSAPRVYVTGYFYNSNASSNANAVVFGGTGTTLGTRPQLGATASITNDVLLVKYLDNGTAGAYQWSQVGGGTSADQGLGVAVRGQAVSVVGSVVPTVTFGTTGFANPAGGTTGVLAQAVDNTLAPLPVQLVQFGARPAGPAAVQLSWTTASEVNSARFEVQRSADGTAWQVLGGVAAAGSSASTRTYGYLDGAAPAGLSYYRLRQLDLDGTAAYSPVRTVTLGGAGLALYPNPAPGAATLTGAAPGAVVRVLDALGRVAATATVGPNGTAALGGLAPGLYVVRVGAGSVRLAVE